MAEEKLMTEKEWKEKQTRKTRKKHIRNALALILVAVISVVGTLAYLSKKTTQTKNVFKGSSGLDLSLYEPKWESNKANSYTPSQELDKDPQLVNGSEWTDDASKDKEIQDTEVTSTSDHTEYVAMRVDFIDGDESSTTFTTYGNLVNNVIKPISFTTDKWTLVKLKDGTSWMNASNSDVETTTLTANAKDANSMIFLYKSSNTLTELTKKGHTEALFQKIQIRNGGTTEPIKNLDGTGPAKTGDFPTFTIVVKGAAVDKASYDGTTGHELSQAETDLVSLLTTN